MTTAVELVRERFGFYHTGIFLIDAQHEYAVLKAATSEEGAAMLAAGHKLKVGETGIVGFVTGTGQPRIAQDTDADSQHYQKSISSQNALGDGAAACGLGSASSVLLMYRVRRHPRLMRRTSISCR